MIADEPRSRRTRRATEKISALQARRIALAAQGFGAPRPKTTPGRRLVRRTIERLGFLQIDSVNVLVRSHYLPLFSRLGPYAPTLLEEAAWRRGRRRTLFEYWGHEASLLPVGLHPLLRWRMARAERGEGIYRGLARFGRERRAFIDAALAEVVERGALRASELTDGGRGKGSWWGWSEGKGALEWLFWAGRLTTATRRGFERVYDLPERVLPPAVLAAPTPSPEDAQRELLRLAARALGVATERDLREYFRLEGKDAKARIAELVDAGDLLPVQVEGWAQQAYLDPNARWPRSIEARALLSPFDSLVFERTRTERLFGFRYRIEIYVPAPKRVHGYYVLPFLLGDRLVARVDLKADRADGVLRVQAAHAEPHAPPETAEALRAELALLSGWLELDGVTVMPRGDLAGALAAAG
ncbi:MAG: winged helix-turn-helix domain-containing protein [Geminicoccaceae bacterium]